MASKTPTTNLPPITRCDPNGTDNPEGTHGKLIIWSVMRKGKKIRAKDKPFRIIKPWGSWTHKED